MESVPTVCPVCGAQLNVDDEKLYAKYGTAYLTGYLDAPVELIYYCSGNISHTGTWQSLLTITYLKEA